ncbi:MAG: hypothetical protein ACFCUI_03875 [Bernardetiaceae bacterium]
MHPSLTLKALQESAQAFCQAESVYPNPGLYGITDGKAIGTYIEHKFQQYLESRYSYQRGSSAKGIDLPETGIMTDIKVTSIRQPQSSSPFKDAKQKIFGLGYHLLIFVYDKIDDPKAAVAKLDFVRCVFLDKTRTADYTTTFRLREMIKDGAIQEDIVAYLQDKNIPADETTLHQIAEEIIKTPPQQGYLTISNALQWRLQYTRVVQLTENIQGITKIV